MKRTDDRLERACREAGLPLTLQRRAVFEALAPRRDHPTADDLFAELRPRVPGLSRTTVYRVLETLVRLGLARRACHDGAAARFDPVLDRHHHLVCSACGRIEDLHSPALDAVAVPATTPSGFRVSGYSVYLNGLCARCRRGSKPKGASR